MAFSSNDTSGASSQKEESADDSYFPMFDFLEDFSLCCQDVDAIKNTFCPSDDIEGTDLEGNILGNRTIEMEKPWRPPLYRDMSLLVSSHSRKEEVDPEISPSSGIVSHDDSIPSRQNEPSVPQPIKRNDDGISLPPAFVPPKDLTPRPRSLEFEAFYEHDQSDNLDPADDKNPISLSHSKPKPQILTANLVLRDKDIMCGRGAPTGTHPGNLEYKKVIKKYEMKYLCSKRSEKPDIATKVWNEFRTIGARFVKRERKNDGAFVWVEIDEKHVYEKICQSLREGAPRLRRQMMSTKTKRTKNKEGKESQRQRESNHHVQVVQQRQDCNSKLSDETTRTICDVENTNASFCNGVETSNLEPCHPMGQKQHSWYNMEQYYDCPYYVHLPPHLGGERLFQDRIE